MALWSAESATEFVLEVIDPVISVAVLCVFMVSASTLSSTDPARSRLMLRLPDSSKSLFWAFFAAVAPVPPEIFITVNNVTQVHSQ